MKIIIDPGHGGVWRPTPPRGDPGVVTPDGNKIESHYNWIYANTLRDILVKAGFEVVMTREHDNHTVDNRERTRATEPGDIFISIHFDSYIGGRRMIYFAGLNNNLRDESIRLAKALDTYLETKDLRASTSSRFGRLYIDDAKCPAVLVEVDRIDRADGSMEARLDFANNILSGIRDFLGVFEAPGGVIDEDEMPRFNTPFQRVFLIENGQERQLDVDRMSVVGDKLYIALK